MAKDIQERSVNPFLRSMRNLHRAAQFGATATNVNELQLKTIIEQLIESYNSVRAAWEELRADLGANPARAAIAARLHPTPDDVGAAIASLRQDVRAVLQAYNQYAPNAGIRMYTFDFSVVDASIIGGFTEMIVAEVDLAPIKTAMATLQTTADVLAPN